ADNKEARLIVQGVVVLPGEARNERVLVVHVEVTLDRVFPVVEGLRQELHCLVAEWLEKFNLRLVGTGNDGVTTLECTLDSAEEKGVILFDRATDGAAELLATEGRFQRISGAGAQKRIG